MRTQTQEGVVVGTPMYLSPEQALGSDIDARSDLFSLGTLLYECIAGKPPFDGISRIEICTKVIRDDPPPPSQFNSGISGQLDRITLKALAKKREERFQSADEFVAALQTVRADLQTQELERNVARIIPRRNIADRTGALATLSDIFRRPRLSVGYLSLGLILALAIGIVWWGLTRARPHRPNPEAQRLYDLAVDALRQGAFFKSSKILQQAVQDDDRFALAHARLAEAWMELDFSDKAKDELIRAGDLVPERSVLSDLDALRLQAIIDTVKRDFARAVESYRSLASGVPDAEKAFALVDLGRAYEKNEQAEKAIESYQDAISRNPRYAAAFLRLGVALRRSQRYAEAETSFEQAHKLFDVSNEIEGIAEVLYQRGILFSQQSKLSEAQAQLQQALQRSVALENKDQQIKVLQQLSNMYIVAGDAAKAHEYSQQAIDLAQASGMENLTTAGLIEIGNAYLAKTNYPEAERNFNEALRLAQLYKGRYNEARALLSLASLRKQQEQPDAARDFAQRALVFFEPGGYGKQTSIAYAILGYSYDELGNYESAQRAFEHQLQLAQQVGDQRSAALSHEGLGIAFLHTERLSDALLHFDEDYRIANSLNAKLIAGYAANYRGTVYWQLGRYDQATQALAEALTIAAPQGSDPYKELLADATVSEAALALSAGKLPEAAGKAQKALELSGSEFKSISVRANCILTLARARLGQGAAARKSGEAALAEARNMKDPRPLSEALLASAEAAIVAGDAQSALTNASEAQKRFAAAKQYESEWRAWLIQARASEKAGDKTRAIQLGAQASAVLATLEQLWGSDNYKSYLNRLDVQAFRKQLAALTGN
jgi:tetratricopeptide (TPR) repeat protein